MPQEVYNTTGQWHEFVVPDGVSELDVTLKGAGASGQQGGVVEGRMLVSAGAVLHICVGEQGKYHSNRQHGDATWGGGGYGGHGRGTGNGGDSGGGASAIKQITGGRSEMPSWATSGWAQIANWETNGWVRAVAGGAGGSAGDGGDGGTGGAEEGEKGHRGSGNDQVVEPTGGTQSSPGRGGRNKKAPSTYDGTDAQAGALARAGRGGQVPDGNSHGGGGGGGGWFGGGGGNASGASQPASGGAGGSNYVGGLVDVSANRRGTGGTGNGEVTITWQTPPGPGDVVADGEVRHPPPPPSNLKVNGIDLGSDTTTRALTEVTFTAVISNPDDTENTGMVVKIVAADNDSATEEWNFGSYWIVQSNYGLGGGDLEVSAVATGLAPNTKYYVRAYSLDSRGQWSQGEGEDPTQGGWTGGSFWTNRPPSPPSLLTPSENNQFDILENIFFSWSPIDADDDEEQTAWELRTRRINRPNEGSVVDWVQSGSGTSEVSVTLPASNFSGNQFYLWAVRTRDKAGMWSKWSQPNSFYVQSASTPPIPLSPRKGEAVEVERPIIFRWRFSDPTTGGQQQKADIRYRVVGTEHWITLYGEPSPAMPGSMPEWALPAQTFMDQNYYEWQARTTNTASVTSGWSESEWFWTSVQPTRNTLDLISPELESVQPPLGCGNNRVYIFDRGGEVMRGEITDIAILRYHRKRDDITSASIIVKGFGKDCGALLSEIHTWMHEIVIFRDGKRVWEGPITRIGATPEGVEIEAKDVMAYVYRRIMRQGYNDTYRKENGIVRGGLSVVRRAAIITMNALVYDDPNVLRWITEITHSDDAVQHRAVPDHAKTAWEEIDDLAANAGLDYTVVGRRIIYWDTHRALGRLPEMRDGHFSEPVHVTEYGMSLANYFAVTNNNGVYGSATRGLTTSPTGGLEPLHYGWMEQLVSAFGETEGVVDDVLTQEARVSLEETLTEQAERGIAARWPAPVVVRVPDNATIMPDVNIGFDQLVPGVWIPVRAQATIREVAQWQKLDAVTVEQMPGTGEKIMVTLSPAPNGGSDPDADAAALED